MRDFAANADGTYPFQPDMIETRKYFARAVVKAFAPDAAVDAAITFAGSGHHRSRSTGGRTSR